MIRQNLFAFMIPLKLSYVKTKLTGESKMARIIDGDKMNLIGDNVRRFRKQRKLSQQKLSNQLELLGVYVCRGSISRIEDKSRTVTDIELFAIAKTLNVSIENLFENI